MNSLKKGILLYCIGVLSGAGGMHFTARTIAARSPVKQEPIVPSLEKLPNHNREAIVEKSDAAVVTKFPANTQGHVPVRNDPANDIQSTRRKEVARQVDKLNAAFFKSIVANGGDPKKFRDMLIERQFIIDDIISEAKAQGINIMNRDAYKPVAELIRKSISEYNLEMKAAVGEQAYKNWIDFEKMKGEINLSEELAKRMTSPDISFSPSQQALFVNTLFDTKDSSGWKKVASMIDRDGEPMAIRVIPETALERMQAILSAQQYAKFYELYQEQQRGSIDSRGP